ncbi:alkaline phosphatase [Lewinella sp. IMCC34183]|uniref:alkaline phosphatase n=1 Tax=Lewinella sp. IMCC34183 TaxID=2248762 RepID=UPI0018E55E18|nr:alkaline phosphatase [Lewinella sp. IMCC34183]
MSLRHHLLFFLLPALCVSLPAQETYRVHSHNDYLREVPFWQAYSAGAASIEVDLVLRNDTLYTAHGHDDITPGKTFAGEYLETLDGLATKGTLRPVQLLVDLKTDAYSTLDKVVAEIAAYPTLTDNDAVTFAISGNRPRPDDYDNYPPFIRFDHQRLDDLDRVNLDRVALISQSFTPYSVWNGYGRMTAADQARVDSVLQRAAATGKPFRFWATPDTKTAWARLAKLGVGYINTDKPATARAFLDRLDTNTYTADSATTVYAPAYRIDPAGRPRNVILLIGDGNGLAQLSAARLANGGQLTITNLRDVGLMNTASADDPVTDSAAAGTAMATGRKTNNRAIGVDTAGRPLPTLIEILAERDFRTGIVTTDAIYGATPSAFYAHTPERDDTDGIVDDLVGSGLSFFVAGGKSRDQMIDARFTTTQLEEFRDLTTPRAVYHGAEKMPTILAGRGDFLPRGVGHVLSVLEDDERPFFLLVEGAQIDNGGHANDITTVVTEMLDFDRAVATALRFADRDGETLVIVTADHETGGLGVAGGDHDGTVRAEFLSVDHSGILVPVFAYGPGAGAFRGVFENTEIHAKILAALSRP